MRRSIPSWTETLKKLGFVRRHGKRRKDTHDLRFERLDSRVLLSADPLSADPPLTEGVLVPELPQLVSALKPAPAAAPPSSQDVRRLDANADGDVTPLDVLVIVNYLQDPEAFSGDPYAMDVNRDGRVTAADADPVVAYLNGSVQDSAQPASPEPDTFSRHGATDGMSDWEKVSGTFVGK